MHWPGYMAIKVLVVVTVVLVVVGSADGGGLTRLTVVNGAPLGTGPLAAGST